MFSVYQKIVTPETSPVLGPINANNVTTVNAPEPFLLCNYCCSHRNDKSKSDTTSPTNRDSANRDSANRDSANTINTQSDLDLVESKYPFGHATHYTYRVTTPRILCEFETGTPPSP
jgi:hypothetical protein